MKNKLTQLFNNRSQNLLNIYCTAGFPHLNSTTEVILALQQYGADMVEIGMPYSDPVADGPVIQDSNATALNNGMNMKLLFEQLASIRDRVTIPVILMGYINPVMQYGLEMFCKHASEAGVSGVIIPDLPAYEYEKYYKPVFKKFNLCISFLVSPTSSLSRIKRADKLSDGFLYVMSSSSTTGTHENKADSSSYFRYLSSLSLRNRIMIGFGIKDRPGFETVCQYAAGGIIGTAFIKHIANEQDINTATAAFINSIKGF